MNHDNPDGQQSPVMLSVALSTIALGGGLLFLIFVSGGLFLYVLLGVLLIGGVGLLHYAVWGQSFDHQTEDLREEARLHEEMKADPW